MVLPAFDWHRPGSSFIYKCLSLLVGPKMESSTLYGSSPLQKQREAISDSFLSTGSIFPII